MSNFPIRASLVIAVLGLQAAQASIVLSPSGTSSVNYDFDGQRSPRWSGGALLTVDGDSTGSPIIRVFGRDGQEISDLTVAIPQAKFISVIGIGRGETGLVAASGSAVDTQGKHNSFLALFPPNPAEEKVIALNEYSAQLVTVAADGTVWTAGLAGNPRQPTGDAIRHFDANGRLIGSLIPTSSFSSSISLTSPHNWLAAAGNRVGFFAPAEGRYIEFSLDGRVTADIRTAAFGDTETVSGFALTNDGRALVSSQVSSHPRQLKLYNFDTRSGAHTNVGAPNGMSRLYGGEGNSVVGRTGSTSFTFFTVQDLR